MPARLTKLESRACAVLLLASALAAPARAQIPDTAFLSSARADALAGLYALADGRVVYVTDLRDQLGGAPVLSLVEYASGRTRALYPVDSVRFEAGSGWFERRPVAYSVRFDESVWPARGLRWEEGGRVVTGRRAPLRERAVSVRNGDVVIAGTLVLPASRGPHPAVLIQAGSGPETRRIPRYVGDFLAYHGVAVLAVDKRGSGESTGDWNGLTHAEWATDVEALLDFLRRQPDIDASRIGLYGNSESGFVVPMVAARRPDVRFLVCRVCPALPGPTVILDIETGVLRRQGLADSEVTSAGELLQRMMRYALDRTGYDTLVAQADRYADRPWRRRFIPGNVPARDARFWDAYRGMLDIDPRPFYARLKIPVLVILGERDDRLLVEKHRAAFDSLRRGGVDLTLWVVPNASHGLLLGPRNSLGYPAGLHDSLAAWVVRAARR